MRETSRFKYLATVLAGLVIALIAPVAAASSPATAASPRCGAAEYRQLDFWIGDWDTFETDITGGPSIARARVEPIAEGCAVHELYEQTDGLIGDSILSYDPVRKQWQQTWVTNRGSIMVLWGGFKDDALVLEGESHLQDGNSVMQRITWKVQDDGVRESAVLSKDGGKTWAPAFDVLFLRREEKSGRARQNDANGSRPASARPGAFASDRLRPGYRRHRLCQADSKAPAVHGIAGRV